MNKCCHKGSQNSCDRATKWHCATDREHRLRRVHVWTDNGACQIIGILLNHTLHVSYWMSEIKRVPQHIDMCQQYPKSADFKSRKPPLKHVDCRQCVSLMLGDNPRFCNHTFKKKKNAVPFSLIRPTQFIHQSKGARTETRGEERRTRGVRISSSPLAGWGIMQARLQTKQDRYKLTVLKTPWNLKKNACHYRTIQNIH